MFKKAQLKLTVFYSILFLSLFWTFSFGLYFWMNHSFGEGYISRVKKVQQAQTGQHEGTFEDKTAIVTIAGDVALSQLQNVLFVLNGAFLFIIPTLSWFLAKRTLFPIETAHEKQKQFVSDASHELRTPLSIITGEIDVALKKPRALQEYKRTLLSNREEVERLSKLVENLLFLARDDQNTQVFQKTAVDLTDVINTVRAKLQQRIKEKKLIVRFEPADEDIIIKGQEELLHQLIFNLFDNEIKYTPKHGTITVALRKKKDFVEILIQDSGIGIDKNNQEKIFDRFFRVDSSRSEIKGYGLGLSIVKSIVEKHHGTIRVSSQKGKGAIFIISLPYQ